MVEMVLPEMMDDLSMNLEEDDSYENVNQLALVSRRPD